MYTFIDNTELHKVLYGLLPHRQTDRRHLPWHVHPAEDQPDGNSLSMAKSGQALPPAKNSMLTIMSA